MTDVVDKALHRLAAFFEKDGLWWGVGISVAAAVVSLAVAVAVVVGWSPDHFREVGRAPLRERSHPVVRVLVLVGKNVAGAVLLALGLVMALPGIPGQGILTMIIGLTLLDFPGKRRLERRLIGRPAILRRLNDLRARFKRPPLVMD